MHAVRERRGIHTTMIKSGRRRNGVNIWKISKQREYAERRELFRKQGIIKKTTFSKRGEYLEHGKYWENQRIQGNLSETKGAHFFTTTHNEVTFAIDSSLVQRVLRKKGLEEADGNEELISYSEYCRRWCPLYGVGCWRYRLNSQWTGMCQE